MFFGPSWYGVHVFLSKSRNHPGKLGLAELDLGWAQGRTFRSKKKRSRPLRNALEEGTTSMGEDKPLE